MAELISDEFKDKWVEYTKEHATSSRARMSEPSTGICAGRARSLLLTRTRRPGRTLSMGKLLRVGRNRKVSGRHRRHTRPDGDVAHSP